MPPVKRQKRPRKTPTFKENKFAIKYIEFNGNASKAALASHDVSKKSAKTLGYQLLQKPIVQETIKEIMNNQGMDLKSLTAVARDSIHNNLNYGKYSQAAGVSMLQFLFKLHNAIPAKQSIHTSVSRSERLTIKSFDETTKELELHVTSSKRLLEDLNA